MKMTIKHGLKTAAAAGAFSLLSGMAFANDPGVTATESANEPSVNATDSANDPSDVAPETQAHGAVNPDEPTTNKQEATDSANDTSGETSPDGMLPEEDGLDDDHGVDSDNVPLD
ncbi:MAG: hypothetical protein L0I84_05325 [Halomonas subglaciescola]|nr:hypothetical protein [Halomonas subglaciescola]